MGRLTLAEAQWRAQEWREWCHEKRWGVLEWIDQPPRILGLGVQPAQEPVKLDPDAPLLMRHVVPPPESAPAPKPKPKPKPRQAPRPASRPPPATVSWRIDVAPWRPRSPARAPVAWRCVIPWTGPEKVESIPHQCDHCTQSVLFEGPMPPGVYWIICPQCVTPFHAAIT